MGSTFISKIDDARLSSFNLDSCAYETSASSGLSYRSSTSKSSTVSPSSSTDDSCLLSETFADETGSPSPSSLFSPLANVCRPLSMLIKDGSSLSSRGADKPKVALLHPLSIRFLREPYGPLDPVIDVDQNSVNDLKIWSNFDPASRCSDHQVNNSLVENPEEERSCSAPNSSISSPCNQKCLVSQDDKISCPSFDEELKTNGHCSESWPCAVGLENKARSSKPCKQSNGGKYGQKATAIFRPYESRSQELGTQKVSETSFIAAPTAIVTPANTEGSVFARKHRVQIVIGGSNCSSTKISNSLRSDFFDKIIVTSSSTGTEESDDASEQTSPVPSVVNSKFGTLRYLQTSSAEDLPAPSPSTSLPKDFSQRRGSYEEKEVSRAYEDLQELGWPSKEVCTVCRKSNRSTNSELCVNKWQSEKSKKLCDPSSKATPFDTSFRQYECDQPVRHCNISEINYYSKVLSRKSPSSPKYKSIFRHPRKNHTKISSCSFFRSFSFSKTASVSCLPHSSTAALPAFRTTKVRDFVSRIPNSPTFPLSVTSRSFGCSSDLTDRLDLESRSCVRSASAVCCGEGLTKLSPRATYAALLAESRRRQNRCEPLAANMCKSKSISFEKATLSSDILANSEDTLQGFADEKFTTKFDYFSSSKATISDADTWTPYSKDKMFICGRSSSSLYSVVDCSSTGEGEISRAGESQINRERVTRTSSLSTDMTNESPVTQQSPASAPLHRLLTQSSEAVSSLPKLQVCEKAGSWWALNASVLQMYRRLYHQRICLKVPAEVVPLSKVPKAVQEAMDPGLPEEPSCTRLFSWPESTKSRQKDGYGRLTGTDDELVDQSDVNGNAVTTRTGLEISSVSSVADFNTFVTTSDEEGEGDESDFDDDEDAEALTCDVCDRAFVNTWQLHCHQAKKRHYGCSTCEGVFPSLLALEAHKEENHHWSDEDLFLDDNDDEEEEDENDFETGFYDDDEDDEEERENLL